MPPLAPEMRRELERTVVAARGAAETGARAALEALAVHHHEPYGHMARPARDLRNALRAHARQLGDRRDPNRGTQAIDRLVQECAYEHWHRMLFARFLAENDLLIEPETKVSVSLEECRELAREQGVDPWELASHFAQHMLPAIFRPADPVLQVPLSREDRMRLEGLLEELPAETFRADDSLGWVYQFWQAQRKDEVNASGDKIGANELPAVTQLFTEHYMVLFLLHNTVGAWHAGRVLASRPELAKDAATEDELRAACSLPGYTWDYLRFLRDEGDLWRPAAGTYAGWPQRAAQITVMDPCCGSGHFLVAAFEAVVRLRMHEEGLPVEAAVQAVLGDNLHGLEIDPRCTQLAGFAVAFAAWRMLGNPAPLPALKVACSGLAVGVKREDWVALAGKDERLQAGMKLLYDLFEQAPILGSLIDPKRVGAGDLLVAQFHELRPLLEKALAKTGDNEATELATTAQGLTQAAELLAGQYTLVITNVPYLGRVKQDDALKDYCETHHPKAKADLATCFIERCLALCASAGTFALVTPQNWLFLTTYREVRKSLLECARWQCVVRLGENGFESSQAAGAFAAMVCVSSQRPTQEQRITGQDVGSLLSPREKANALQHDPMQCVSQESQLKNPDCVVSLEGVDSSRLLGRRASCFQGISPGDTPRIERKFWEVGLPAESWRAMQTPPDATGLYRGRESVADWEALRDGFPGAAVRGREAWDKRGIAIGQMRGLPATLYTGELFSNSTPVIIPANSQDLAAIWVYCSSGRFAEEMRRLNPKLSVDNGYVSKVPFDADEWHKAAAERFPQGLPKPHTDDPTQWHFSGHPRGSSWPLQVGVGRLLGYRWPRQNGASFMDCPALKADELEEFGDPDGIVCLSAVRGEAPAVERLRGLLHSAYGPEWAHAKEQELLAATGTGASSLEEWLRDDFFSEHCSVFHERPFVWHVWDGRKDGFHALVDYRRLVEGKGSGRKLLEALAYSYLGDWITRQEAAVEDGEAGAEDRLDSAQELQRELAKILEGDPPYDIFVRWKPLQEQPVGWEPDINDGVRVNIRPFMSAELSRGRAGAGVLRWKPNIKWDKDRGKEPERPRSQYPWFWDGKTFTGERWNDRHLSRAEKIAARDGRKKGAS